MQDKINWNAIHGWWLGLVEDRSSRAQLRRCATVDEVVLSPAYQRFYRYLLACNAWPTEVAPGQNDKLAAIAGLLAHVQADGRSFSLQASESAEGKPLDKPLISELRFRELLKIETLDDLFSKLRRTLPLIGYKTNVIQLARDVYWWNDETKKQWAYSYRWPVK